jgi:hypothetical protein
MEHGRQVALRGQNPGLLTPLLLILLHSLLYTLISLLARNDMGQLFSSALWIANNVGVGDFAG